MFAAFAPETEDLTKPIPSCMGARMVIDLVMAMAHEIAFKNRDLAVLAFAVIAEPGENPNHGPWQFRASRIEGAAPQGAKVVRVMTGPAKLSASPFAPSYSVEVDPRSADEFKAWFKSLTGHVEPKD